MGELVGLLPVLDEARGRQADRGEELLALLHPVLVPHLPAPVVLHWTVQVGIVGERHNMAVEDLDGLVRADEELELHLLELAAAERVVARRHLVAEALAHLRTSLRKLLPICAMPNGTCWRLVASTLVNWAKMACAVSGRR